MSNMAIMCKCVEISCLGCVEQNVVQNVLSLTRFLPICDIWCDLAWKLTKLNITFTFISSFATPGASCRTFRTCKPNFPSLVKNSIRFRRIYERQQHQKALVVVGIWMDQPPRNFSETTITSSQTWRFCAEMCLRIICALYRTSQEHQSFAHSGELPLQLWILTS